MRRAITVAELTVAMGIAILITGVLVAALLLSRRGEKTAERDAALEALVLAQERLASDLRCLAVEPGAAALGLDAGAKALGIWTWSEAGEPVPVTYRIEASGKTRTLVRTEDGRRSVVGMGAIRAVRCALHDTPVGKMVRITLEAEAAGVQRSATFAQRIRAPMGREAQGLVFKPAAPFPDKELDPARARPKFRVPAAGMPRPVGN